MTPSDLSPTDAAERISRELSDLHAHAYGEPVQAASTHVLDDLVVSMLDVGLTTLEHTLIDHGPSGDAVRQVRRQFQEAIGSSFIAVVEHHTGRRVVAFLSETHLDPSFVVEVFRLEPRGSGA